jgi:hypothetical protein
MHNLARIWTAFSRSPVLDETGPEDEGGFHQITVEVGGHPEVRRVQTRPGCWLGPK